MTRSHQTRRDERLRALADFVADHEAEHGEITADEMTAARRRLRTRATVIRGPQNDVRTVARTRKIDDLVGILHRPGVPALTIDEINEGIAEGAAESGMRSVAD